MNNYIQTTQSISLEEYGIKNASEVIHNPSYEFLFEEELKPNLEGFEKGQLTELGKRQVYCCR